MQVRAKKALVFNTYPTPLDWSFSEAIISSTDLSADFFTRSSPPSDHPDFPDLTDFLSEEAGKQAKKTLQIYWWLSARLLYIQLLSRFTSNTSPCDEGSLLKSLSPKRFKRNFGWVLFKSITVIDGWDTCCEIAHRRMSLDLTDDKSTLVQVMAWCHQATSHYLSQCWPSFLLLYGVTRL